MLLICATSLSVLLVLCTGISNLLAQRAPDLALAVNPFHAEARLQRIVSRLARSGDPAEIRREAERQVALAPADARGYSLLAEVHYRSGDTDLARELFAAALDRAKTEIHALKRSIEFLARQGDFAEVMEQVDLIARRWPDHFPAIAPHLAVLLQDPAAYGRTLELLRDSPPWAGEFFRALSNDENGLDFAYRLQVDLSRQDGQSLPLEAENTMRALIRVKQYDLAYRLFLFTQTEADKELAGYVFNGDFAARPGRRPFDWQIRDNASAEAHWAAGEDGGHVRIRFLGKPVRTVGVSQTLHLPSGRYALMLEYSAAGLEIPRGLFLRLRCQSAPREAARIVIPEERAVRQRLAVEFEVDPDDCSFYILAVETALIADSFLYAYRGTVTLHGVHIERIES